MTQERRQKIEVLCLEALERDPGERAAFLDSACAGDTGLRHDVERLLALEADADDLLEVSPSLPVAAPLPPGTRLGPHVIEKVVGAGGMGEVYRARDTRLGRAVAIKILPPGLSADPARRHRFEQEARAASMLNHPHICTLYDVGSANPSDSVDAPALDFLVMEFLDGETLSGRLRKGPMSIEQALTIAIDIADALSAAHRRGVIHRDLKPGNVMLTKSGAKLLDFGLARLTEGADVRDPVDLVRTPPRSAPATAAGVIAGTLPYMSPEQLQGLSTDPRTDIWALGAIVFEMVTGRRPFQGTSAAILIGAIEEHAPAPLASFQPLTPPALDRLVRKCLEKDRDDRPDTAHDVAYDLRWIRETITADTSTAAQPRRLSNILMAALLLAIITALITALWRPLRRGIPSERTLRLSVSLVASGLTLSGGGIAISPDGGTVVFAARGPDAVSRLYSRRLDEREPQELKGTEQAIAPFFSPDGRWVAFVASGRLQKILLGGATAQSICPIDYQGISRGYWTVDGRIIFTQWPRGGIWSVSEAGGVPHLLLSQPADIARYLWPEVLPGGRTVLFTILQGGRTRVAALSLATGRVRPVLESAACARYLPSTGHLVYAAEGHVRAVPFDTDRLEPRGDSVAAIDDVALHAHTMTTLDFTVSQTGTVAWLPASIVKSVLVWRDRRGSVVPLGLSPRAYSAPSLSNDGRQVTVSVTDWPSTSVWVGRVEGEPLTRLAPSKTGCCSIFSRDGEWVAFSAPESSGFNLYRVRTDGRQLERLTTANAQQKPTSFSRAGDLLLFNETEGGNRAVGALDLRTGVSRRLVTTSGNDIEAVFSPDERSLAYQSDESGQWEIYMRRDSRVDSRRQVSVNGGTGPVWNPRGDELFYQTGTALMSARIANGVPAGVPSKLFSCWRSDDYRREFDVMPDGERFLFIEPLTRRDEIHLMTNWFDVLQASVPAKK
jgi:serine/threonine-protein kinase